MVEGTLSKADPAKRCYRKVGDVLVERTVKEVLPAVQKNKDMVRACVRACVRAGAPDPPT